MHRPSHGLFALVFAALLVHPAAGQSPRPRGDDAKAHIIALSSEIVLLLAAETSQANRVSGIAPILRRSLDLEFMARTTLGPHWDAATAEQRRRYQAVYADYVIGSYARRLARHQVSSFAITAVEEQANGDVTVREVVERVAETTLTLEFRVRGGGKDLRILDVSADGVSLLLTQINDFAAFLQGRSVDDLVTALEGKVAAAK